MFGTGKPGSGGWTVAPGLLAHDFHPLQASARHGPPHRLLWRLRHVGSGILEEFATADEDSDGLVTQGQMLKALKHLRVAGAHKETLAALVDALDPAVKRDHLISYVDLCLALTRLDRPSASFSMAEFTDKALPALVNACRRAGVSEAEFKGRLLGLVDPSTGPSFHHEASDLCAQIGVPVQAGEVIIDYIDVLRADFALYLPMWTTYSRSEASQLLEGFFKLCHKADFADRMIGLTPERFLGTVREKIPVEDLEVYSDEELEYITIVLGEASPFTGQPNHLDGEKIFDAAKRQAWREVFPDLFEALPTLEDYDEDFDAISDSFDREPP